MISDENVDERLDEWAAALGGALGIERDVIAVDEILALAGVAARAVARPAAPLTSFAVGYAAGLAAGRGDSGPHAVSTAIATARELCADVAAP